MKKPNRFFHSLPLSMAARSSSTASALRSSPPAVSNTNRAMPNVGGFPIFLTAIACAFAIPAGAATVLVDINGGDGPTQSGWTAFNPTGPTIYPDAFGLGQAMTVAMNATGGERNRNRDTTITGPFASLSDLLVDFYGARQTGGVVTLSLTLSPGVYSFTSYHHNAENNDNEQQVTASIVLTELITDVSNPSSSFVMVNGVTDLAGFQTYQTDFTLTAAGTVDFTLIKTEGSGEHGFNGFEITQIPEPGTAMLALSALAAGLVRRRRSTCR